MPNKNNKIKKSLRASFWDGIFAFMMVGFTQDYVAPYALALKATVKEIGLLSSLPNLCASFVQLKSADLVDKFSSRKRIILISVYLQALSALPLLLIPYLFKSNQALWLIFFAMLFTAFGALSQGPWASLMSEYIPSTKRGRYFGWRNRILNLVAIVCSLCAGLILQIYKNKVLFGFWIILTLALVSRFISWHFLTRMYEPKFHHHLESKFTFLDFIKRARQSNFVKFVFFVACFNFSVNLAAPFFPVFMLRDLKFAYLTYTIVMIPVIVTTLIFINRWGKLSDRIGNIKVLKFTSFIVASLPLFWVFGHHPLYLIFVQALGGFAWSGFNLCAVNFIFDSVSSPKRTRCHSYFNVLNGLGISLGAFSGGYLAAHLPQLFGYRLISLFVLSAVLRFLMMGVFIPKIQEVRPQVKKIGPRGILKEMVWR